MTALSSLVLKTGFSMMILSPFSSSYLKLVSLPCMVRPLVVMVPCPGFGSKLIT